MPVAMTTSLESKSERTDLNTQELLTIPAAQEMKNWDARKVLRWIQQRHPNILVEEDDLNNFKKARIAGRAFLAFSVEHFKTYDLPLTIAVTLKDLADEVKEGELSNQITGRKRKEDEIDLPEPPIPPKRNRQEDPLSKLATKAREQRKLVRKIIRDLDGSSDQHSNPVRPLPGAVNKLSDPTFERELAFPFIGRVPVRFKLHNKAEENWSYLGRTKFKKLVEDLENVRESQNYSAVWVYGTQGYGKSHMLAALVCYLAARRERVVYIPDCREWLRDPVRYLQTAMLFAWADDITTQEEIKTLTTEAKIEAFIGRQENIIFVVDQLNALTEYNGSTEATKKRADIYQWLMRFTASTSHRTVFSSSANYREYQEHKNRQSSYFFHLVHGGFNRTEMDQWWKRHSDIKMTDDEKSDFEDITGRIPLLLDKCIVNGEINLAADYLRDIYDKAAGFVQRVRDKKIEDLSRWQWYYKYAQACIRRESVPNGYNEYSDLIDHRYFYHESNEQGNYTCGLVRNAVADQLLNEGVNFADTSYLPSLARSIDNRSIAGFMIEHAVLSFIQSNGLAIGEEIGTSMELRVLRDPFGFHDDFTEKPVLYRPKSFNFKAINGIILLIKDTQKTRKKLMMFPLQITLAPATHADSRVEFFKSYGNWITDLSRFDVEVQFLWITPESRDNKEYPAGPDGQPPKHLERYIPFKVVSKRLWEDYEVATRSCQKRKAAKSKPPTKTVAKGKPSKKIAAKEEPPKRRSARLKQ